MKLPCQILFVAYLVLGLLVNMLHAHKKNSTEDMVYGVVGFAILTGLAIGAGMFD